MVNFMKCRVKYLCKPNKGLFYFVDLRDRDGELKPVGVRPYRKELSTISETKRDTMILANHLSSLGYDTYVVRVNP